MARRGPFATAPPPGRSLSTWRCGKRLGTRSCPRRRATLSRGTTPARHGASVRSAMPSWGPPRWKCEAARRNRASTHRNRASTPCFALGVLRQTSRKRIKNLAKKEEDVSENRGCSPPSPLRALKLNLFIFLPPVDRVVKLALTPSSGVREGRNQQTGMGSGGCA